MAEKNRQAAADAPDFEHWGPAYELPDDPVYDGNVKSITTQTPAHADVLNQVFSQLVENTEAVKRIADSKASPEPAAPGKDGLLAAADKVRYDDTASTVETLVQHYPVNGEVGGDLEGVFPTPAVKADAVANKKMVFAAAGTRGNITSGETIAALFGKLAKWYTDLKSIAWSGNYNDLSNRPASFPPAAHTHDDRYFTEGEVNNLLGGKAAASHNHDAGNITSGVLPVGRGGTGVTGTGTIAPVNADLVDGWHRDDIRNWNNITNKPGSFAPAAHNQSASTVTAGTFPGQIVANYNTAYTTQQIRNIYFSTSVPASLSNGSICFVYE